MNDRATDDGDAAPAGPLVRCGRLLGWWTAPILWVLAGAFLLVAVFPVGRPSTDGGANVWAWIGLSFGGGGDVFPTSRAVRVIFRDADRTLPGDAEGAEFTIGRAELSASLRPDYDDHRRKWWLFEGRRPPAPGVARPAAPGRGRWQASALTGPSFLLGLATAWAGLRWGLAAVRGDCTPWTRPAGPWRRLTRPWLLTAAALAAAALALPSSTKLGARWVGCSITPTTGQAALRTADAFENWPGRRSVQFTAHRPANAPRYGRPSWVSSAWNAAPARSAGSRDGSWFVGRYETPRGRAVVAAAALWWLAVPPAVVSAIIGRRAWRRRRRVT